MLTVNDLHPYQNRAIKRMITNPELGLFLDIGLGKTTIALHALTCLIKNNYIRNSLIIAPIRVMYKVWPDEITKWEYTCDLSYTILHGSEKAGRLLHTNLNIFLINYEGLSWLTDKLRQKMSRNQPFPFDAIVFDESSLMKDPKTVRFKKLKGLLNRFKRKYLLTATPVPNNMLDIWSQVYCMDTGKTFGGSFYAFRNKYFYKADWMGYKWAMHSESHGKIISKLKPKVIRLDARDYIKMTEPIYNDIILQLSEKQMDQYKELEKEFFILIEDIEIEVFSAVALSNKLRQFLQGAMYVNEKHEYVKIHDGKLKALEEIYETAQGNPLLVPIQFRFELDIIKKKWPKVKIIAGGIKNQDANTYIDQWNRGEIDLLICHPLSLARGLNMQHGGHIILWHAIPWSLDHYQQLNGRLHRQNQKKTVIINHFIFKDTIDEVIIKALRTKGATQATLLKDLKDYARKKD